jgi:hypothetical protein
MSGPDYNSEISKTGFVLEHSVSRMLQVHGWTVINNRYYVDDIEGTAREIDIIAYKASFVQHVLLYTTLIVSCKKSAKDAWILISKEADAHDPNLNWNPLHIWTNDRALNYFLDQDSWREGYCLSLGKQGCPELVAVPNRQIFAFQEMDRKSGKPGNDKNIFAAVTSLMKAQAYELSALPQRKRSPSLYQFNLVSVIDSDLIRIDLSDSTATQVGVTSETYLANYIVNRQHTSARVRFVQFPALDAVLTEYDELDKANRVILERSLDQFFKDVMKNADRVSIYLDDFKKAFSRRTGYWLRSTHKLDITPEKVFLDWSEESNSVSILVEGDHSLSDAVGSDGNIRTEASKLLEKYYRYRGDFHIAVDELPF